MNKEIQKDIAVAFLIIGVVATVSFGLGPDGPLPPGTPGDCTARFIDAFKDNTPYQSDPFSDLAQHVELTDDLSLGDLRRIQKDNNLQDDSFINNSVEAAKRLAQLRPNVNDSQMHKACSAWANLIRTFWRHSAVLQNDVRPITKPPCGMGDGLVSMGSDLSALVLSPGYMIVHPSQSPWYLMEMLYSPFMLVSDTLVLVPNAAMKVSGHHNSTDQRNLQISTKAFDKFSAMVKHLEESASSFKTERS
jgi:hypothetical protein